MTSLVLGTAQLGAGYGVTNTVGRLSDTAVDALVGAALDGGISLFDTAPGYGDAEERLGRALAASGRGSAITKFALPADGGAVTADAVLESSRARLGGGRLHAVLLHRVEDLRDSRFTEALAVLRAARAAGTVGRIGVSIYDAADLDLATTVFPDLDILQIPGSVVDRRLLDEPAISSLRAAGVEVHVRSLFLQGLLLARPEEIPERFGALVPVIAELRKLAEEAGTTVADLLVQQVRDSEAADALVVGATSVTELDQLIGAFGSAARERLDVPGLPVEIVDPRRW